MRVLCWVTNGYIENLVRMAARESTPNYTVSVVTDTDEAIRILGGESIDITVLGQGRLGEWTQAWHGGRFGDIESLCPILLSSLPVSSSTLLEASQVGIFDVIDLTMDLDEILARMTALYGRSGRCDTAHNAIVEDRMVDHRLLREVSDEMDRRILSLIARGDFDKEICDQVFLSLQTVRNRISRMLAETGAKNRTHLAMMFTSGMKEGTEPPATFHSDRVA